MRALLALGILVPILTSTAHAQQPAPPDTLPATVVQRFVDAANARDAAGMAALVAPGAVFARFPDGAVMAAGRDSIHAFYARMMPSAPPDFRVSVKQRIADGPWVIDREEFTGTPAEMGHATWMYLVRGGLIERAWMFDPAPATTP